MTLLLTVVVADNTLAIPPPSALAALASARLALMTQFVIVTALEFKGPKNEELKLPRAFWMPPPAPTPAKAVPPPPAVSLLPPFARLAVNVLLLMAAEPPR